MAKNFVEEFLYLVHLLLIKGKNMNIGKISNIAFKGAYAVVGMGKDAAKLEDKILEHRNVKYKTMQINRLGYGILEDDLPAYFLVTTGDDIKKYNQFAQNYDEYRKIADMQLPDYSKREDFANGDEYIKHFVTHEGALDIDIINQWCNFNGGLNVVNAKNALKAIGENRFNFNNGDISR